MEENKENVVEETTKETTEQVDTSKFKSADDPNIIKVDLTKPPTPKENETKEDNVNDSGVVAESKDAEPTEKQEEVQPKSETQETPVLEEVTEQEVKEIAEKVEEAVIEAEATGQPLPENIQKLVEFMEETGGDLNDYVALNRNYDELEDQDLLYEYYKSTKPHLNNEEINFLMEDQFSYDEDTDSEKEIRRKKLALKEQVASAKSHLDGQKSKYYEEIKAGSKLTPEQQKAMDFFNRYNKEEATRQKTLEDNTSTFINKTNKVFNDKFKGFEYNVGDKKFRYNVKDVNKTKESQSDINNFVKKFLNKNNVMEDAAGYHKGLYTAMNPDAIAKHFYEQGMADAMKNSIENAKNVNMTARQSHGEVEAGGIKVRVLGDNTADFKFKIKNKNK
jgi:hypothetical protein